MNYSISIGKTRNVIVLLIVIFLSTWQDFFLVNYFGEIFRSPIVFLFPLFLFFEFNQVIKIGRFTYDSITIILLFFVVFFCISSLIQISDLALLRNSDLILLGESVVGKSLKILMYYILFLLIYRFSLHLLFKLDDCEISNIFFLLILFYSLFIIVEYIKIPSAFLALHSNKEVYFRVRMLTAESSWTGGVAVMLLTGLNIQKTKKVKFLTFIFLIIFLLTSGSKAFIALFFLSGLFFLFQSEIRIWVKIGLSLLGVLIAVFLLPIFIGHFMRDLEDYSSVITRSSASITSITSPFRHPIGVGGTYYYYISEEVKETAYWIVNRFRIGNVWEIMGWGNNGGKNISAGSELGHWLVFIGIPGSILFFVFIKQLFKNIAKDTIGYFFLLYVVFSIVLVEPMYVKPNYAIFFALIMRFKKMKSKDEK